MNFTDVLSDTGLISINSCQEAVNQAGQSHILITLGLGIFIGAAIVASVAWYLERKAEYKQMKELAKA